MIISAAIDLDSLNGSNGFVLNGIDKDDRSSNYVSDAGDVNGDSIDDLIIGATGADPGNKENAGASYVVFGSTNGFTPELELANLNGTNGFVINGIDEYDSSGISVSSAGDVNGDGIDDLIIGASGGDPGNNSNAGESYVVFGSTNGFAPELELTNLNGTNGFVVNGIDADDFSGISVSSAGDVNGDGIDDLIIGATGSDPGNNSNAGESYVVFGSTNFDFGNLITGTNGNDALNGTTQNDRVNGLNGNDTVIGSSGEDEINGDNGNDILRGNGDNDSLDGGNGRDQLFGGDRNDLLVGGSNNDLLRGQSNNDTLDGGSGNDTLFGEGGTDRFLLRSGDGRDLIQDYQDGTDKFFLVDGLQFSDLTIVQNINGTEISLTDTDEILASLNTVAANQLDALDFLS
jgi:Ca2+-binding RTX toxin-like protein